jgi:hypothetical protein
MRPSKGLIQAYETQDFVFKSIMALKDQLSDEEGALTLTREDSQAISTLVAAWDRAQDRVRIHRGKPLPSATDAKRGRKLTGKPVGAVIELQELKRIEQPAPDPMPEPIDDVISEKPPLSSN